MMKQDETNGKNGLFERIPEDSHLKLSQCSLQFSTPVNI